jgi:hypothetical protein
VTDRERLALAGPPDDPAALAEFPESPLGGAVELFRVVLAGREPWYFGNRGHGRFDLQAPEGTCYLATEPEVALVEALGGGLRDGVVSRAFVEARRLRRLRVPFVHRMALLADRRARRFGLTAEIHTVVPYDIPQRWARRLRAAGFDALASLARHDPSGRGHSVALFGRAGERRSWRRGRQQRIDATLLAAVARQFGIGVADVPTRAQLRVLE